MKKLFTIFSLVLLAVILSACTGKEGKFDYENGVYFAIQDRTEGQTYRYWVTVTIKDKKITNVTWDAYHVDGAAVRCKGESKYVCSEKGNYGDMGGQYGDWHEQAKRATDWIVKNQKIGKDITIGNDGKTDAISSVSVTVKELFDLIDEAFENGPVAKGDYNDGFYYVETALTDKTATYAVLKEGTTNEYLEFTETFKTSTMGSFLVVNGTIVLADINARHDAYVYETDSNGKFVKVATTEEGTAYNLIKNAIGKVENEEVVISNKSNNEKFVKYVTKDSAGKWYGMSDTGKVEWNLQVQNIEKLILQNQGLTVNDGKINGLSSDATTGASIHVTDIITVWNLFSADATK